MKIQHVAIIPDGNRRWAKLHGKPSIEGHRFAVEHTLPALFDAIQEREIPFCTIWLLSPENFSRRTPQEVKNLLFLLRWFLKKRIDEFARKGVRLTLIGAIDALPDSLKRMLHDAVSRTQDNTRTVVTFAINYGGRDEILRAVRKITHEGLSEKEITPERFGQYLDTQHLPAPDLIIRTGGEQRTSGFMLWQAEYAEYCFTDTLFPDFSPEELARCIESFEKRQRRFGS